MDVRINSTFKSRITNMVADGFRPPHCGAADQVMANLFENSILEFAPMVHTRR